MRSRRAMSDRMHTDGRAPGQPHKRMERVRPRCLLANTLRARNASVRAAQNGASERGSVEMDGISAATVKLGCLAGTHMMAAAELGASA